MRSFFAKLQSSNDANAKRRSALPVHISSDDDGKQPAVQATAPPGPPAPASDISFNNDHESPLSHITSPESPSASPRRLSPRKIIPSGRTCRFTLKAEIPGVQTTGPWPGSYRNFHMRVSVADDFAHTSYLFPPSSGIPVIHRNFVRVDDWDWRANPAGKDDLNADIVVENALSRLSLGASVRSSLWESAHGPSDYFVINRMTSTVMKAGQQRRIKLHQMPNRLPEIFQGISTFNYFLENNVVGDWLSKITIVIHLRGPGKISSTDGQQLDLSVEPQATYCFSMRNDSAEDLFPYLFYFDPHMYSIRVRLLHACR
jgi:hypothetical protein